MQGRPCEHPRSQTPHLSQRADLCPGDRPPSLYRTAPAISADLCRALAGAAAAQNDESDSMEEEEDDENEEQDEEDEDV